ncbi:MAG: hypothetical protein HC767_06900 [Akkermansiaceae bacterium]|nr:hypothetical protein [Akkermansiaceae bacterium]
MISDCCHSGSMLDHPQQQISGNKDPNAPPGVDSMNPMDILGMFFKELPVCPFLRDSKIHDSGSHTTETGLQRSVIRADIVAGVVP